MLLGWWTYCAIVGFEFPSSPATILVFAAFATLVRFVVYCSGLGPSFKLWGRLASGRIIVPGFDQVVVTSLIVLAMATAGGVAIRHSGSWYPVASACVVGLLWFTLLGGGPTMRKWILTGPAPIPLPYAARGKQAAFEADLKARPQAEA